MKHLLRRVFYKHWYSFCSAHRPSNKNCPTCAHGHWVFNRWRVEREALAFRSYRAAAIARGETVDTGDFYQKWLREGRPSGEIRSPDAHSS